MGKVWASALIFIAVAPILAALASWAAERTAAFYSGAVTRADKPAGSNGQLALAIGLALAAAWLAIAAWGAGPKAWAGFLLAIAFVYSGLVDAKTRLLPHAPTALAAIRGRDAGVVCGRLAGRWHCAGGRARGGRHALADRRRCSAISRSARRSGLATCCWWRRAEFCWGPSPSGRRSPQAQRARRCSCLRCAVQARAVSAEIPFGPGLLVAIWLAWAVSAMRF